MKFFLTASLVRKSSRPEPIVVCISIDRELLVKTNGVDDLCLIPNNIDRQNVICVCFTNVYLSEVITSNYNWT